MAVRLACPACGAAFTPKPADAGRIVPCARCGSDLQMPAAVPAAAPKPVAKRPARKPDPDDEDVRPRAAAGASFLWLWVLLGSGTVGTFVGAAVFYFALREQPAQNGPIAEKPPLAAPPGDNPPKVEPPKVDPPKAETPKVEPPKVEPKPPAVPPKPKDPAVVPFVAGVPGAPGAVVAPNTIPGLKFYLACDAVADGKLTEGVSGKKVGTGTGLALTDGPRGNALRLTHDRKDANRHAVDLTDAREQLAIPANRPFTLAFWARRVRADAAGGFGAFLFDANTDFNARHARALYLQLLPNHPALAAASLTDMSNRADPGTVRSARPTNTVADPTAWTHFALVRDDAGKVRWLVNGADAPGARAVSFTGELRYDVVGLLRSADGRTVVDLDEFCLFDRALTADELGGLTGQKVAPPPKDPLAEVKLPPPGAVAAPADFKGLRFHLPCDKIDGESLVEAVSGKSVGKGRKLELVDGPRGKAVRVRAGGPGGA
ncbi:MAG: hypothetical protein J0I06_16645, partial [Planctomycetes bacterium]|nr:hypothetical protein [Planctomycetota bacterium]